MAAVATIPRHANELIVEALTDTRIVAVEGPRQAGKSTLCAGIAHAQGMTSTTLDDPAARDAARSDPTGFLAGLGRRAFIDELQRAPDLILGLKMEVDREPTPGRYLVTGSSNLLNSPGIGDSLAGRVERIPLRPFSQAELARRAVPRWLDGLWKNDPPPWIEDAPPGRTAYSDRIAAGGFPAAVLRSERRRQSWFDSYIAALVTRDIPDLVDVRRPDIFPALLRHLAAGSGSMARMRPIAQSLSVDEKTVRSYVRLLELLHLVVSIPAWTPGMAGRVVQTPRLFIEDTGLLTNLLSADATRIAEDDTVTGRAYETWVAMELTRLLPYTETRPRIYHWRTQHGVEVDIVLEDRAGRIVGVEIKSGATVGHGDTRGLRKLREVAAGRFVAGVVLSTARQTTPLGDRLWALPLEAMWDAR